MEKFNFQTTRTARYYLVGNTIKPKRLWLALHGYGQQAKYFSKNIYPLIDRETLIVVPEALNRYYLKGYNGRVGATWMTSDDREADIEDNSAYLEDLLNAVLKKFDSINQINALAFSQGVATTCRWHLESEINLNRLVLWAGSLPCDVDFASYAARLNSTKIFYVFGNKDEFFDRSKILMNERLFVQAQINYQLITFEGKHVIEAETLKELSNA